MEGGSDDFWNPPGSSISKEGYIDALLKHPLTLLHEIDSMRRSQQYAADDLIKYENKIIDYKKQLEEVCEGNDIEDLYQWLYIKNNWYREHASMSLMIVNENSYRIENLRANIELPIWLYATIGDSIPHEASYIPDPPKKPSKTVAGLTANLFPNIGAGVPSIPYSLPYKDERKRYFKIDEENQEVGISSEGLNVPHKSTWYSINSFKFIYLPAFNEENKRSLEISVIREDFDNWVSVNCEIIT